MVKFALKNLICTVQIRVTVPRWRKSQAEVYHLYAIGINLTYGTYPGEFLRGSGSGLGVIPSSSANCPPRTNNRKQFFDIGKKNCVLITYARHTVARTCQDYLLQCYFRQPTWPVATSLYVILAIYIYIYI